ncbi:SirB2 family protein [Thauera sp. WH-1]|uniref:SirB2 family protein n=1 Tax=Thauera sp. WH-1 TaxID=3398230 RepID=UPI0039FBCFD8
MYYAIKHLHVSCVVLSVAGFLLRGLWMISGSPLLKHRLTRVLPHVIDSVLLLSAIALAVMIAQYPFAADWVTAKVLGLLAYIGLGTVALKRGRTLTVRVSAFSAALLVYAWIASVAMTKNVAGFFA